jgi:hypothetical protein
MGSRHTSSLALRRSEHLIAQVKLALLDQGKDRHRGDGLFVTLAMRKVYVVLTRPSMPGAMPALLIRKSKPSRPRMSRNALLNSSAKR